MRKNNKLIVIISIVLVLAIASAIFAYLFMATDMFKSDKELFVKYISQNLETFQKMANSQTIQTYQQLKEENKYDSSTSIKLSHSEGGEVSNPLNNLSLKLDIQKDNEEQYMYVDGQILFEDEEYLEAEIIKQQELYGIRFSDVAKQFVTVKQDGNFEKVANNIGINSEVLETIINIIDGTVQESEGITLQNEMNTIKDKYLNIIKESINQGKFDSLKNAMITYNNETVKANAYTVEFSSEQVESLVIEILNNVKTETIILEKIQSFIDQEEFASKIDEIIEVISEENGMPTIKITVYERNVQTIRTIIEIGLDKIVVENSEENGETKIKVQTSTANDEQVIENKVEISKKSIENQENYNITIENINAEEMFVINFVSNMTKEDNNIVLDMEIGHQQNITIQKIILKNAVTMREDFENKKTLEPSNNITLNDIEEAKQIIIVNLLKENVPIKVDSRIKLLQEKLNPEIEENNDGQAEENESEMSQTEINKFNSKFEFYTGSEVSFENVKTLLEIVKDNISSYEITPVTNGNEGNNSNDLKYNFKLSIEANKQDVDAINKIVEKMNERKKYKVSISYKQENGLIDYITINEVTK